MTINTLPISFEFFPPKGEDGISQLMVQHDLLLPYGPRFFSITYGAGGSTRDRTRQIVTTFHQRAGIPAVPHLSCIGDTSESLKQLLDIYKAAGINRIVALRGDLPQEVEDIAKEFHYADQLVSFIRQHYGDTFELVVAAYPEVHPEASNAHQDLINFKRKVEAGANAAITQYFYNPDAYEDFLHRCQQQGITIPIYPGIMPITNHDRLVRFSARCGAEIPRWIEKRLLDYQGDDASLQAFGAEVVAQLCEKLMALGAPGFHFYILNQAQPTLNILSHLGRRPLVRQAA
ncbi:MAG: methylenetetrahydrofolate reductase [NAD(P)H] [Nodosilinea sp.]